MLAPMKSDRTSSTNFTLSALKSLYRLPSPYTHSDIDLQLCMWNDYHIFLIVLLVFTRLLLNDIYHLIELLFLIDCWCDVKFLFNWRFNSRVLLSNLRWETGGLKLASTITFVLQANWLTKCASHPKNQIIPKTDFSIYFPKQNFETTFRCPHHPKNKDDQYFYQLNLMRKKQLFYPYKFYFFYRNFLLDKFN